MRKLYTLLIVGLFLFSGTIYAQRKMEKLGRGVIALHSSNTEAFISWRLLGTEPSDLGFNIYRSANAGAAVKLNATVLISGTNFYDSQANFTQANSYFVKPVLNGVEQAASAAYTLAANTPIQSFIRVPIRKTPGYIAKFIWVGDLDGDGEYDFVFDKQPADAAAPILLEAYKRDGTFLWQLDCGPNSINRYSISPGSSSLDIGHGDNFTVYDINNDGKSEVIVRTANGVKFGDGTTLTESVDAKQFISVLNGMTGAEISRIEVPNRFISAGPMNGHMAIAYLDGINPSIVWEAKNRNPNLIFNDLTTAWSWSNGGLVQTWQFTSNGRNCPEGHAIRVADLDGDGKDEISPLGFAIDHDGSLLWTLGDKGYVHGDRFSIGDLDPSRPGLEGYAIQQINPYGMAWVYYDAKTSEVLNTQTIFPATDLGRGMVGDFDPRYKGYEFYTFTDGLYNVSGAKTSIGTPTSYPNMRAWWDGDLLSENLDGGKMTKWNYLTNSESRIFIDGQSSLPNVNQTGPDTPGFYGDILGDWREEMVYEASDGNSLVIYTTPLPTTYRFYTLAHNPEYRNSMCVKGYYQSNMLDYYLGADMVPPPMPPIQKANKYWKGTSLVWDKSSANWMNDASTAAFADGDTVMFDVSGNNADTIKLNTSILPSRIWAMNPDGKNYIISGSGKLTGTMDLIKALPGTFTLCGKNDYTGKTTISEGTLALNGSMDSKVLVTAKGNLGGSATLNNGIILEKGENIIGGRLSPGNGNVLGTLRIQTDLAVPGNNNFAFDITPGSAKINDSLIVNGNLTFEGINKIIVNFANGKPVTGTYTLIRCTGTLAATVENFVVEGLSGVPKNLIIENKQIKIQILGLRSPKSILWKGAVSNNWDYTNSNFEANSVSLPFVPNDSILFNESALQKTVTLSEVASVSQLTFDAVSNYTLDGTGLISGPTDLVKLNTNTLDIQLSNNTYTGKTIVEGGTLSISTINSAGKASSLGSAAVNSDNIKLNGVTLIINNKSVSDRGMTLLGNTTLTVPVANNYAVFGGDITGTGTLIKEGPGQLGFIGRNTYSGGTILRNGTITLGSSESNVDGLGTGPITFENGVMNLSDVQDNNQLRWNIIVPSGKSGTINMDGRCSVQSTLTGAGTLNLNMPFIRTSLDGNWSAFTGTINVTGDFRINNTNGYANAAINLLVSNSTYTTGAYSVTNNRALSIGELSGVAASTLNSAIWTIGSKNTDATFNGTIAGNSITKVGTGAWTLTGANTYAGTTTVSGGKLFASNLTGSATGTGAVTVNTLATLAGAGTVSGAVTVASGGTISPGTNNIGILTLGSSLVMQTGSNTEIEINKTAGLLDKIIVTGAATINGTLKLKLISGSFAVSDAFKVLNAASYSGTFTAISPATPGMNMDWDLSTLATDGTVRIVGAVKQSQTVTIVAVAANTLGNVDFPLSATASTGLPITFSTSDASIATIVNGQLHMVGAGTCNIIATQEGNVTYNPASAPTPLVIAKAAQTLTFNPIATKKLGDASFTLSATASTGLAVSYTSSNTALATVSGNTLTMKGAGSVIITASQVGDVNYLAAANTTQTLLISQGTQSINFTPPLNKRYGDATFTLSAIGSESGTQGTFTIVSGDAVTLSGNTVTIVKAGSVQIKASLAGDVNYLASADVVKTLVISQGTQAINFTVPTDKKYGYAAFDLSATGGASGNPVTFTILSGDAVTLSGKTVTIVKAGTSVIRASQLGNANFYEAITVEKTLTIAESALSIKPGDVAALGMSVFPNPTDGNVTLKFANPVKRATVVVETLGSVKVYEKDVKNTSSIDIDLSTLATGVYILKVIINNKASVSKIIKK